MNRKSDSSPRVNVEMGDTTPIQPNRPLLRWASGIGVDARVRPMDPPGDAEVGATEQRVPAIAFPKSDRLAAPVAGDGYGGGPGVSRCGWSCPVFDDT